MGPPGPLNAQTDTVVKRTLIKFEPTLDAVGWLYVLDVPSSGARSPISGGLVDLATAPRIFSESARLKAQHACLVRANEGEHGGDLSRNMACPPMAVAWPLRGAPPGLEANTEELFPSPKVDAWYRRFLRIPLVPHIGEFGGHIPLAPPLPVAMYMPSDLGHLPETTIEVVVVEPPLLRASEIAWPSALEEVSSNAEESPQALAKATTIVFHTPVVTSTPPVDSGQWNHAVLVENVPLQTTVRTTSGKASEDQVSLSNVLVQFSPLDRADWDELEQPGTEHLWTRAVWIVRSGTRFTLHLLLQRHPGGEARSIGPVEYQLGPEGTFRWRASRGAAWAEITAESLGVKQLFATLVILRELSAARKAAPFPEMIADAADATSIAMVAVRGQTAYLQELGDDRAGSKLVAVCDLESHDEYSDPIGQRLGAIFVRSPAHWATLSIETVHRLIHGSASDAMGD